MASLKKASVLSIALLVATFAAGFLGGVAWQRSNTVSSRSEDPGAEEPAGRGERRMVIDDVGLEPARRAEVEEIIQHFMVHMRALNDEFEELYRPRQRELFRLTRDSIKSVLAPAERALYDSLLAERYGGGDRSRGSSGDARRSGHSGHEGER